MSEMLMCHVVCDGENCSRVFGNEPSMDKVRARAKKLGWARVLSKDYCPLCQKKLLLEESP